MIDDGLPLEVEAGTGDLSPLFGGVLLGSGVGCWSRASRSRGLSDAVRRLEGDLTNLPGFKVSPLHVGHECSPLPLGEVKSPLQKSAWQTVQCTISQLSLDDLLETITLVNSSSSRFFTLSTILCLSGSSANGRIGFKPLVALPVEITVVISSAGRACSPSWSTSALIT